MNHKITFFTCTDFDNNMKLSEPLVDLQRGVQYEKDNNNKNRDIYAYAYVYELTMLTTKFFNGLDEPEMEIGCPPEPWHLRSNIWPDRRLLLSLFHRAVARASSASYRLIIFSTASIFILFAFTLVLILIRAPSHRTRTLCIYNQIMYNPAHKKEYMERVNL